MAKASSKPTLTTGRRKTSSARVFLTPRKEETASFLVNSRSLIDYFPREIVRMVIMQPLEITERTDRYDIRITVSGGGLTGQAGAVRHGIARALQEVEPELRPALKKAGLLTRDPRAVERKKPGRHKARRGTQFSKR